jgi:hypothetical protein
VWSELLTVSKRTTNEYHDNASTKQVGIQVLILLTHIRVLISLWLSLFPIFLFAAQPKEFFFDGLKKLEQQSHKCVWRSGGICGVNTFFFNPVASCFLYKAKDLQAPSSYIWFRFQPEY